MNIQKSRLAAMLTAMFMVCMMVTLFVVPAFAAEVEEQAYYVEVEYTEEQEKALHDYLCSQCNNYQYSGISECGYMTESGELLLPYANLSACFNDTCTVNTDALTTYFINGEEYVIVPSGTVMDEDREDIVTFTRKIPEPPDGLSAVVTKEMLSGVLNEIVALLPVVIPVMIGFIGLRKGISFLQSVLHSA